MLCLSAPSLPQGNEWQYELKLDGYRALAIKTAGKLQLRSRNNKDFANRFRAIAEALEKLPDETVVDGEIVAFDKSDRPSFNALQNYGSSKVPVYFYGFDLLMLAGRDIRSESLDKGRELLRTQVLSKLKDPIRYSPSLASGLGDLIESVREHKLEGLIAKRRDSRYESGQRTGAWLKMRINQCQAFDRRLHAHGKEFRCSDFRVLRRRRAPVHRTDPERIHARSSSECIPALSAVADRRVPIRQSARSEVWPLGPGLNGGQDERVPLAEAAAGGPVRVCRMDAGWPFAAFAFHCAPRGRPGRSAPAVIPADYWRRCYLFG
jgi:hypothetical protein